jgi:hypothetical protein
MFIGFGLVIVGPKRHDGIPRLRKHFACTTTYQRPRWLSRRNKNDRGVGALPSALETQTVSNCEGGGGGGNLEALPEIFATFDPDEVDLHDLYTRFCVLRDGERKAQVQVECNTISEKKSDEL